MVALGVRFWDSTYDPSLFVHFTMHNKFLLLLYVDDMAIRGDNVVDIQFVKAYFTVSILYSETVIVWIFIRALGLSFSLRVSVSFMLLNTDRVVLSDQTTVDVQFRSNVKLMPTDGELLFDPARYRHIIDQLVYLRIDDQIMLVLLA